MSDAPDRSQQLLELASQISALSAQLNRLLLVEQPLPPPPPPPPRTSAFVVGDRVQILNSYKGLQGQRGIVTRVTRVFIVFRLDTSGAVTSRRRSNLRVVSRAQ